MKAPIGPSRLHRNYCGELQSARQLPGGRKRSRLFLRLLQRQTLPRLENGDARLAIYQAPGETDGGAPRERVGGVFFCKFYSLAEHLGTGQYYLMTIKDKQGQPFNGANTHRLTVVVRKNSVQQSSRPMQHCYVGES